MDNFHPLHIDEENAWTMSFNLFTCSTPLNSDFDHRIGADLKIGEVLTIQINYKNEWNKHVLEMTQ